MYLIDVYKVPTKNGEQPVSIGKMRLIIPILPRVGEFVTFDEGDTLYKVCKIIHAYDVLTQKIIVFVGAETYDGSRFVLGG